MPPTQGSSSGSLTGAPLWTLTVVVILVSGLLFFFISQPLAEAFDALMPAPPEPEPRVEVAPPPPPAEPAEPPPPPPRIWTAEEIEAGMDELAQTLGPLIEAGLSELPTYSELGAIPATDAGGEPAIDEAGAQRAAARWTSWGVIWRNRVDAERSKLPPQTQCVGHEGLQAGCTELHDLLEDVEAVADAETYDDATSRMEAASARLDLYLEPPPLAESEDGDDPSLDVAEPAQ